MQDSPPISRQRLVIADFLMVCGGIGIVLGVLPWAVSVLRLLGCEFGRTPQDWAAHGVEGMGLHVEWAALSSATGAMIGALWVASGLGWRRSRPWAPLVTLLAAINGLVVDGVDLFIFVVAARPGAARSWMLVGDGLAFAFSATVLIGLAIWWRGHPASPAA